MNALIWANSEGNPYFIEEVIRTLIDNGGLMRDPEDAKWNLNADPKAIIIPENLGRYLTDKP